MKTWPVLLGALCATASVSAGDESPSPSKTPMMQSFNDLKWSALPERPGMRVAVLSGDPKTGAYTQIRKVPAGTMNPLHSHSSDLTNVVISGTWYTGADEASARDFGPGCRLHAWELGSRERLPRWKRMCLLGTRTHIKPRDQNDRVNAADAARYFSLFAFRLMS